MNMQNAAFAADEPIFRALLVPHRSLGRRGFNILIGSLCLCWLVTGAIFLVRGAWPVFGFFGLDILLLYIAFRLNYRAARARETVSLSRTSLDITRYEASGRTASWLFNPLWARFSVVRHEEIGITDMAVHGQGKRVMIGSFLNPEDRESFAMAFSGALARVKRG